VVVDAHAESLDQLAAQPARCRPVPCRAAADVGLDRELVGAVPKAMKELRNGWPSMVPRILTSLRVPKNSAEPPRLSAVTPAPRARRPDRRLGALRLLNAATNVALSLVAAVTAGVALSSVW
jgi:hypothetical protein